MEKARESILKLINYRLKDLCTDMEHNLSSTVHGAEIERLAAILAEFDKAAAIRDIKLSVQGFLRT